MPQIWPQQISSGQSEFKWNDISTINAINAKASCLSNKAKPMLGGHLMHQPSSEFDPFLIRYVGLLYVLPN